MIDKIQKTVDAYWEGWAERFDKKVMKQLLEQVLERNLLPQVHMKLGEDSQYHPTLTLQSVNQFVVPSSYDDEQEQKQRFHELLELTRNRILSYPKQ